MKLKRNEGLSFLGTCFDVWTQEIDDLAIFQLYVIIGRNIDIELRPNKILHFHVEGSSFFLIYI